MNKHRQPEPIPVVPPIGGSTEKLLGLDGNACCNKCKGKGHTAALSGRSFPSCIVIMDRRQHV